MDLLSTSKTVEKLKMYDDAKGGVKIKNMTEVGVKNKNDIYGILILSLLRHIQVLHRAGGYHIVSPQGYRFEKFWFRPSIKNP